MSPILSRRDFVSSGFAGLVALNSGCIISGTPPSSDRLSVLSWNTHHGESIKGEYDIEKTIEVIRASDANVVALQEVEDNYHSRSNYDDQPAILTDRLATEYTHTRFYPYRKYSSTPNSHDAPRRAGDMILSKYPIRESRAHEYEVNEPAAQETTKTLNEVRLDVDGTECWMYDTHLWVKDADVRIAQTRETVSIMDRRSGPTILGGDLNATPDSTGYNVVNDTLVDVLASEQVDDTQWTWRSDDGERTRRIDYIFTSADLDIIEGGVRDTKRANTASDHRPIRAVLDLSGT